MALPDVSEDVSVFLETAMVLFRAFLFALVFNRIILRRPSCCCVVGKEALSRIDGWLRIHVFPRGAK